MSVVLSEHLPLLATAPSGIQKLRGLILELAVRGKLVPQDPNDEPASELLKRIAAEKTRLARLGKLRGSTTVSAMPDDESSTPVPFNWVRVLLGEIMISRDGERIPVSKDERNTRARLYDYYGASGVIDKIDSYLFDKPLLLIGEDGANLINRSTPIAFIARGKYWVNNHAHVLDGISESFLRYIELHINAIDLKQYVTGTAQPKMNQAKMNSIPISLPPETEQRRIVAKVDELMALCDRLEAEQTDAASAHAKLVETLLGTVTQSRDADELAANWQRLSQHFDTLFGTETSLDALKQAILQLAVMGKLVPQDPNDEPASELLMRIAKERARLEAEGVCKKLKGAPVVGEGEMSFTPPVTWVAVRLSRIVSTLGDGLHGTPEYESGTPYFFINGNNLINGKIVIKSSTKSVSSSQYKKHQKPLCDSTILVSINGSLGRIAYYNDEQVILGKSACFFNLLPFTSKDFVRLILESEYFISYAFKNATGSTIKNLGLKSMNDFPVPLPPLAEQHRIVAKVDELMALCDRLKADLAESRTQQARLSTTLIDAALQAA